MFDEVLPTIRKTGTYSTPKSKANPEVAKMRAEAMMLNAKSRIANQMMKLWTVAGVGPQYQALAMNNYYDDLSLPRIALKAEATAMYDLTTIARHLGVVSKSGNPHAQAIGAIIEKLKPLEEGECQLTPYSRNGHDDVSPQYTLSVEHKIKTWLEENKYPTTIRGNGRSFTVRYKEKLVALFVGLAFGIFLDYVATTLFVTAHIDINVNMPFSLIVACYIVLNEIISIAENLYQINPHCLPGSIAKLLKVAKEDFEGKD